MVSGVRTGLRGLLRDPGLSWLPVSRPSHSGLPALTLRGLCARLADKGFFPSSVQFLLSSRVTALPSASGRFRRGRHAPHGATVLWAAWPLVTSWSWGRSREQVLLGSVWPAGVGCRALVAPCRAGTRELRPGLLQLGAA